MFGKVASFSFALSVSALASISQAADGRMANGFAPISPVQQQRDLAIPQPAANSKSVNALPHTNDAPTAPLPPALWPGLILLATLGGAKLLVSARRQIARG